MYLRILGNQGLYPSPQNPTSGYLISHKNTDICIDFGSGILSELIKIGRVDRLNAIFISHFHFDHSSDLGVLTYRLSQKKNNSEFSKKTLFIPKIKSDLVDFLISSECYNIVFIEEDKKYDVGCFSVEFYKVEHPVLCYGAKFFAETKAFGYSADSIMCNNLQKIARDSDLFLCDAAFLSNEEALKRPHLTVKEVAAISERFNCKTLITHFLPNRDRNLYKIEAEKFGKGRIFLCEQGLEYKV